MVADLQTVISDRISKAFNTSSASYAVVLDISKAFDRLYHTGLHNFKSCGIFVRYLVLFHLFSVIDDLE